MGHIQKKGWASDAGFGILPQRSGRIQEGISPLFARTGRGKKYGPGSLSRAGNSRKRGKNHLDGVGGKPGLYLIKKNYPLVKPIIDK